MVSRTRERNKQALKLKMEAAMARARRRDEASRAAREAEEDRRRNLQSIRQGGAQEVVEVPAFPPAEGQNVVVSREREVTTIGGAPGLQDERQATAAPDQTVTLNQYFTGSVSEFATNIVREVTNGSPATDDLDAGARGLALGLLGAVTGGRTLNKIADSDYDPAAACELVSAPRGADREVRTRVIDHDTTNRRKAEQGRDAGENRAPVQVALKNETTKRGTLISQAAKLAGVRIRP